MLCNLFFGKFQFINWTPTKRRSIVTVRKMRKKKTILFLLFLVNSLLSASETKHKHTHGSKSARKHSKEGIGPLFPGKGRSAAGYLALTNRVKKRDIRNRRSKRKKISHSASGYLAMTNRVKKRDIRFRKRRSKKNKRGKGGEIDRTKVRPRRDKRGKRRKKDKRHKKGKKRQRVFGKCCSVLPILHLFNIFQGSGFTRIRISISMLAQC